MADGEVKHASIGLDLNINGLAEFRKADEMTTQFVDRMRGVNTTVNDLRDKFSGFGSAASRDIAKPIDSVKKLHDEINLLNRSTTKVGKFNVATPSTRQVNSMHKLVTEYRSLGNTKLSGVKGDFNDVNKQTDEGSEKIKKYGKNVSNTTKKVHGLRDMFWGSFAGNALSNAFSDVVSGAENAVKEGMKLSAAGARIKTQWEDIGLNDKGATSMIEQIADIRSKSNFAGTAIDSMQKKFYTLTGSAKQARALTNEMSAFGAEAGKSGDQVAQLANTLGRSLGGKTVSAGFFNRAFGSMPELRKQVVQASGMTTEAFNNALKNSKITGTKLEGYMLTAAKGSGKAWEQFLKTPQGKMAELQGTYTNLKSVFAKPVVSGLTKALDDAAKKNGGLDKTKKTVSEIVTKLGETTGKGLEDVINFIVKNHDSLAKSGQALGSITKNLAIGIWQPFGKIFSAISGDSGKAGQGMKGFADGLDDISKHKKAIQDVGTAITGLFALNTAKKGFNWTKDLAGATKNSVGRMIFKPKIDTKTGKRELTLFAKAIKGTSKGIWSSLKWTAKIGYKGAVKSVQLLGKGIAGAGKGIGKALVWTAKVSYAGALKALSGLRVAASLTGRGFKALAGLIVANPFVAVAAAVVGIGIALTELYKHNKKFRKFVNGLASDAKREVGKIGKYFSKMGSAIGKSVNNMRKAVVKRFGNLWSDAKRTSKSGIKTLERGQTVYNDFSKGRWSKLGKDTKKLNNSMWKTSRSIFRGGYDYLNDLTGGRLDKMLKVIKGAFKDIGKEWHSFWNGIDDWFGGIWKSIGKHAASGINGIIKVLNSGISGIDSVIHAFGGKSGAIGKIGSVHFATGTGAMSGPRRPITKPTMAILNDGHDSPETHNREMVVHANGMGELIKGTNVQRLLEPGAEVLNASEAKMMLGMAHFAKGTGALGKLWEGAKGIGSSVAKDVKGGLSAIGNFAGGILSATKKTFNMAKDIVKDPSKVLSSMLKQPSGSGPVFGNFASGFYKNVSSNASDWWKSLWSMVNLDGGGSSAGGAWRHSPGLKETNGFGASRSFGSHDGVDFSGPLGSAILAVHGGTVTQTGRPGHNWPYSQLGDVITVKSDDGYQEIYQEFGGMNNIKVHTGQTINPGQRIATLGALNGAGSGAHVHIGVSHGSLWNHGGSSTKGWFDVTKMTGSDSGSKKSKDPKVKANSAIAKLAKQEVGSGFFKFMNKLASKFGEDAGSVGAFGVSGSVANRAKELAAAIKKAYPSATNAGIAAVLGNWEFESGLNPGAINPGGGASGLGQWLGGRKTALINYAHRHNENWKNAGAQLDFALHGDGSDSSVLKSVLRGSGSVAALANRFSSEWERGGYNAQHVAGARKIESVLGRKNGGHMDAGETSVINEDGWEYFRPDVPGTVIPHDKSVKLAQKSQLAKTDQPITIDARTSLTVQGNMDETLLDKVRRMLEKTNDDKVDKFRGVMGLDDEWGLNS